MNLRYAALAAILAIATSYGRTQQPYSLAVSAREVVVTFHAGDIHGLPVNDLTLDDINLLDAGKPPRAITSFQNIVERPIHAGFLIDRSESMDHDLATARFISERFAKEVLRSEQDAAFAMDFASREQVKQTWTNDSVILSEGLKRFASVRTQIHGTAILDAIYRACSGQFNVAEYRDGGNVLLLFSDGEDNLSRTPLAQVITACQQRNVAIYIFRSDPDEGAAAGPRTLHDLTSGTGGLIFHLHESEQSLDQDLQLIEANTRSEYRLVYRPANSLNDGSFHRIALSLPSRVADLTIRSGYYAVQR